MSKLSTITQKIRKIQAVLRWNLLELAWNGPEAVWTWRRSMRLDIFVEEKATRCDNITPTASKWLNLQPQQQLPRFCQTRIPHTRPKGELTSRIKRGALQPCDHH